MAAFTFANLALGLGAASSVVGTIKANKGQKELAEAQKQQQALATRRSRRQAIRERQILRAQSIASAQGSGSLESSGAAGGIGGLSSQLGESFGYSTQMSGISSRISSAYGKVNSGQTFSSIGGNLVSFGFNQGGTFSGLWNDLKKI